MHNIWEFLYQTLSVSLTAGLLLLVKRLFSDKLSPRWQYGIWSIFALRLLIPADTGRYILLPLPLWLEVFKTLVESAMQSAYSAAYMPFCADRSLSISVKAPQSLTDWFFLVYLAGILFFLLKYALSYLRLRLLLMHGQPATADIERQVSEVCRTYGLKGCRIILLAGLPSAFICGVIRPVLVLPADAAADKKILLHELLHRRHFDALQNIGWSVLRALHWCNPFLHYVFDYISNDMEALCDQRVLERLEGEDRREYGSLLLHMANESYARAPGTTSISNGGKNISRRIAAIVRFKKYPRNMALVSVCIGIVLACPVLLGTANVCGAGQFQPHNSFELSQAMAMTRISRCTTAAGALDTYAKGLLLHNGIYIAAASPLSRQEEIISEMKLYTAQTQYGLTYINSGAEMENVDKNSGYAVYNLERLSDDSYHALLVFPSADGYTLVPVSVKHEEAWVVEETGARQSLASHNGNTLIFPDLETAPFPHLQEYTATGKGGTVSVRMTTVYTVDNTLQDNGQSLFSSIGFDSSPKLNAEFSLGYLLALAEYTYAGENSREAAKTSAGFQLAELSSTDDTCTFPDIYMSGDCGGNGNIEWVNHTISGGWDGTIKTQFGGTRAMQDGLIPLPAAWKARIFWDSRMAEELTLVP